MLSEWFDGGGNMVNHKSANLKIYFITAAFLAVSIVSAAYFISIKTKYKATSESLKLSQQLLESKFQKVANGFINRNSYISKLAKDKAGSSDLLSAISILEQSLHDRPLDIQKIEFASNALNQKIFLEISNFNSTKKSKLFLKESQIRSLEQLDRYIDLARLEFSDWTFEYMKKKKTIDHSFFFKSDVTDITFFRVDHMIRESSK